MAHFLVTCGTGSEPAPTPLGGPPTSGTPIVPATAPCMHASSRCNSHSLSSLRREETHGLRERMKPAPGQEILFAERQVKRTPTTAFYLFDFQDLYYSPLPASMANRQVAACLALLAGFLLPVSHGQTCEGPCFERAAVRPPLDETHLRLARAADVDPHTPEQVRFTMVKHCPAAQKERPTTGAPQVWTAAVRRWQPAPHLLLLPPLAISMRTLSCSCSCTWLLRALPPMPSPG